MAVQNLDILNSKYWICPTRENQRTMICRPARVCHTTSSSLFNVLSRPSFLGAQKLGFASLLQGRLKEGRKFERGIISKKMAQTVENCEVNLVKKMGLVHPAAEECVQEAIEAIKDGKAVAVPTDTLYGFACDACSVEAVNRIYEIKGRKYTSPLAICVGDVEDIKHFALVDHLPPGLLDCLLPGPVTVVLNRGESSILEKSLNPGLDSIGVRVPDHDFIRAIARGSHSALALTSANLSGQPSSVSVRDFESLWEHCASIYDGGVLPSGRAGSTVVDLTNKGLYRILRPGSAEKETVSVLERYSLLEDSNAA